MGDTTISSHCKPHNFSCEMVHYLSEIFQNIRYYGIARRITSMLWCRIKEYEADQIDYAKETLQNFTTRLKLVPLN